MALKFRNIDVAPDLPVREWPFEAVLTALERGGLSEWRRLAEEVRRDPWGPTSRKVQQALDVAAPYGVTELMTAIIADARANVDARDASDVEPR